MILFVFEGEKREPAIFATMEKLFFPEGKSHIFCSYGNNIYRLYRKLKEDPDLDFLSVLYASAKDKMFWAYRKKIDEVYLFFDYDRHDQSAIDAHLQEMLEAFNNETDKGKLYINYPMVESLFYTKELPDSYFNEYTVPIKQLSSFKKLCADFNIYKSFDFCLLPPNISTKYSEDQEKYCKRCRENWQHLQSQNVQKAHWLCTQQKIFSLAEIFRPLNQQSILEQQIQKYVIPRQEVAILNAFPLFLFDYFGK